MGTPNTKESDVQDKIVVRGLQDGLIRGSCAGIGILRQRAGRTAEQRRPAEPRTTSRTRGNRQSRAPRSACVSFGPWLGGGLQYGTGQNPPGWAVGASGISRGPECEEGRNARRDRSSPLPSAAQSDGSQPVQGPVGPPGRQSQSHSFPG